MHCLLLEKMEMFGACKGGWSSVIFFIFVIHVLQGKYGHKQNRKLSPQSAESSSYQLMAQLLSYTRGVRLTNFTYDMLFKLLYN